MLQDQGSKLLPKKSIHLFVDTEVVIDDICLIMPQKRWPFEICTLELIFKNQKNRHFSEKKANNTKNEDTFFSPMFKNKGEIWPFCDIYSQNMAIF